MHVTYEKLTVDEDSLIHCQEFIQARFTSGFHLHDEFELILIVKSHGKLYAGSNVANFNDGDLYFFAPGLPHCFYNTRGYEKGQVLANAVAIWFKKDFLGTDFFEKTESILLKRLIKKSERGIQINNPSKPLIKRIVNLNRKENLEKISDLLLILNKLSVSKNTKLLSISDIIATPNLNDSKIINDVFRYVAENFEKEISLKKAASVANMQKAAFCRYFKRRTKKTFTQFVNETRIMHAQKLLVETDKTVIEVAFECGYENTSYFNRQFKVCCKTSPMVFRGLLKQK
jgi:AraC-like DNA-binding protein